MSNLELFIFLIIPGFSLNKAGFWGFRASKISSIFGKPCTISPVTICSNVIVPSNSSFLIKLPDFLYTFVPSVKKNGVPLWIFNVFEFTSITFPEQLIFNNGDILESKWVGDYVFGTGKYTFKNGNIFSGNFNKKKKTSVKDNMGFMKYKNGVKVDGYLEKGVFKKK